MSYIEVDHKQIIADLRKEAFDAKDCFTKYSIQSKLVNVYIEQPQANDNRKAMISAETH